MKGIDKVFIRLTAGYVGPRESEMRMHWHYFPSWRDSEKRVFPFSPDKVMEFPRDTGPIFQGCEPNPEFYLFFKINDPLIILYIWDDKKDPYILYPYQEVDVGAMSKFSGDLIIQAAEIVLKPQKQAGKKGTEVGKVKMIGNILTIKKYNRA